MRLIVVALLIAFAADASAKCASSGLTVWPDNGELPVNGQIVLTGFSRSQEIIRAIADKNPRLTHKAETIALKVEQLYEGEFGLTQVILTPERPLIEGTTYRLAIKGVPASDLESYRGNNFVPITFKATPEDTTAPEWTDPPNLLGTESIPFGCGPSSEAKVSVALTEPVAFLIELEHLETKVTARFIVPARDGTLRIGHGMCSGAFRLPPTHRHRARLIAIDAAGHSTPAPGAALEFSGPEISER